MDELDLDQFIFLLENPARRRLLELLSREELYPLQLARELGISPTGVMKHLNLLERHGLVDSRSEPSPQGPPRKQYHTSAGFAFRVAVGPNTFEQRFIRLTGERSLPQVQKQSRGLVRVPVRSPSQQPQAQAQQPPQEADAAPADKEKAPTNLTSVETREHEHLQRRVAEAVRQARELDPRARLGLLAHVMDEVERALDRNARRHQELLELKRLAQAEVARMAHQTGCTYQERKVLYCRLDHPTASLSHLAELTDLREGLIREVEERLRARHLITHE